MTKLIVNADDFGYSEGVNHGIVSAHKNGIVTSCTVMANMPGFEHGIELLKNTPTLKCGVHMTLTCYRPLLKGHKTIVDKEGNYYRRLNDEIKNNIDLDEVYREFTAQIERVRERIDITHLDSHHHIHSSEFLQPVIKEIVNKYNLPIRKSGQHEFEGVKNIQLAGGFYGENASLEYIKNNINLIQDYDVVDLMCHPAFVDAMLYKTSSYNVQRTKEHEILTDIRTRELLEENNIELINYSQLPELVCNK